VFNKDVKVPLHGAELVGTSSSNRLGGCGRHHSVSGGSRVAGAVLPPRTAMVATKTPAASAMAGALPTINNQLKAAAAMVMETTTTTTNKM
jgi:hypothetical protein